jgi:NAD+ kinase
MLDFESMGSFQKIILIGRPGVPLVPETVTTLYQFLSERKYTIAVEKETAKMLDGLPPAPLLTPEDLPKYDLIIVVGGDGSLLNAAHLALPFGIPVLGINRGRLGFLTDIHPNNLHKVEEVLTGHYDLESRFLLNAHLFKDSQLESYGNDLALNDVVLLPGDVAQMIAFEIYINQQFVCQHRADGLIIATPTGSTAYALSGGGPILHPQLDAIVLVPMFSHTLSSRPIVVTGDSEIELHIASTSAHVSCDGQSRIAIPPGGKVKVKKESHLLHLIHPKDYNYFKTLREKLKWSS